MGLLVDGARLSRSAIVLFCRDEEQLPDYPQLLLKVARFKGVHRDYSISGGSVSVALYDDRLEIISIGDLHFGLTPEILFREHESKPWNPTLARTFHRRGIIETWGRGTQKMSRLVQEAGHPPPTIVWRDGTVIVTFQLRWGS